LSTSVHGFAADSTSRLANVSLRISCGVRNTSNSLSRVSLISTTVMESIPSSANVEFTLIVFRLWIPAKRFLVLKDADLVLKIAVGDLRTEYWGQGIIRHKREVETAG